MNNRIVKWLLFQLILCGGAAGGAVHLYRTRYTLPAQEAQASCEKKKEELGKTCQLSQTKLEARTILGEAQIGLLMGNGGLAFERVMRAQMLTKAAGLKLESEFDELQGLLMSPDPQSQKLASQKILTLLDKALLIPVSAKGEIRMEARQPLLKAADLVAKGEAKAEPPKGDAKAEPPKAKAEAPKAEAPSALEVAAPQGQAATLVPNPARIKDLDEVRSALLDSKTLLLVGGTEAQGALTKVARARVMLDEAGRTDLTEEIEAALSALRKHDEAGAKAAIDSVLKKLR